MGAARRCNSRVADKAKPVTPENLRTFRIICNHDPGLPSWYVRLYVIIIIFYGLADLAASNPFTVAAAAAERASACLLINPPLDG